MKKVITYGTFDLLHVGHINLLKRAKALGDYLIVGVTTDSYDISRGKLNVQQTLMERIQAVRDTGLADEVIPEEYTGQKIDDIRKHQVDVFAIGSDWEGHFDYLKEYCEVVYLERTANISSSLLRKENNGIRLGIIGYEPMVDKFIDEIRFVGNVQISGIYAEETCTVPTHITGQLCQMKTVEELFSVSDAVYVVSDPSRRAYFSQMALEHGMHVLCESPVALQEEAAKELLQLAQQKQLIFFEAIKTAYFMAFSRLLLLVKSGEIGSVKSVDATCTQMLVPPESYRKNGFGSFSIWGPFCLLPALSILGTEYRSCDFVTYETEADKDQFTRTNLVYPSAVASLKTGIGVKSEGELVITGTKGYIYVPSPWWKTDYFEVRYEDFTQNRRYFYKLEGEGIRYEIAAFSRAIQTQSANLNIDRKTTIAISEIMEAFYQKENSRHVYID